MDELLARHRKELRDLQSRITQKKKQATKKNRKQINSECDALEADTRARHAAEIAALESPESSGATGEVNGDKPEENDEARYIPPPSPEPDEEDEVTEKDGASANSRISLPPSQVQSQSEVPAPQSSQQPSRKPNRQKARLARRAAEIEAASAAAAAEAASQPSHREIELAKMSELIKARGLVEQQIAPDGHCLYSAFAHAVGRQEKDAYREARKKCGEFMLENRDDFEAFLEEPLDEHVQKVMGTAEWGGQTEVMALGRAYGVRVNVLQAEGRVEKMNEDVGEEGKEVWLAYYRHSYGLGEHYNVLLKKDEKEVEKT